MKAISRQSEHDFFAMFLASTPAAADDADLKQFEQEETDAIRQAGITSARIEQAMKEGRAAVDALIAASAKARDAAAAQKEAQAAQAALGAITMELNTLPLVYGGLVGVAVTAGVRYLCRSLTLADAEYRRASEEKAELDERRAPAYEAYSKLEAYGVRGVRSGPLYDEGRAEILARMKPLDAEAAVIFPRLQFVQMVREVTRCRLTALGIERPTPGIDGLAAAEIPAAAAAAAAREEAERRTKEAKR